MIEKPTLLQVVVAIIIVLLMGRVVYEPTAPGAGIMFVAAFILIGLWGYGAALGKRGPDPDE